MSNTQREAALERHNQNGATAPPALLVSYAEEHGLSSERMFDTLARTIFPNEKSATPEHVHALLIVAQQYGLNPFTKELYAFPAKGGGIVPVVSVDGWMKLVNSRPECEGVELTVEMGGDDKTPVSATCRIHRRGWKVPVEITEYYHEVARNTDPWKKQPVRMLRHRAFIQAARIAFGFGGIYEADEAARFAADSAPEHREVESEVVETLQAQIDAEVEAEPTGDVEYAPEVDVAKLEAGFLALGVRRSVLEAEFGRLDRLDAAAFALAREHGSQIRDGADPLDVFRNDDALALLRASKEPETNPDTDDLFGDDRPTDGYDPADLKEI